MNRVMIKSLAKERIRGKFLTFAMALLAFALLTAGCGKVFDSWGFLSGVASILVSLFILNVASYGITFMSLRTARGGEIEFSDLLAIAEINHHREAIDMDKRRADAHNAKDDEKNPWPFSFIS